MKILVFGLSLFLCLHLSGQDLYKTPSGAKYHLASCRMVENVSKKLVNAGDIGGYNLSPCKICKPSQPNTIVTLYASGNKAAGESSSQRCKGYTKNGSRCQHMTRIANGYCYQHSAQENSTPRYNLSTSKAKTYSSTCGAMTKSGKSCSRKVSGGGRCYQHK